MAETLKKVECDAKCGFMLRSHDEKEIIDVVTQHARKSQGRRFGQPNPGGFR